MYKSNKNYKILTPSGFQNFNGIQKLRKSGYRFECDFNTSCEVSTGHKFIVDDSIVLSDNLKIGDFLYHKEYGKVTINNIVKLNKMNVYDLLDVSGNRTFYADGFLHHNCEFLGSSHTVIDSDILEKMINYEYPEPIKYDLDNALKIYENPTDNGIYVMGVDTAKGTGEHSSTIQVLKIENLNPVIMRQVAVYENKYVDPYKFSEIVHRLSLYYNNAFIMCENNAEGITVVSRLWWEYENGGLVNSGSKQKDIGIRSTVKTKPQAVILMKKLIEDNALKLYDEDTIMQLTGFIDKGNNRFGGEGMDDDLISALYWAVFILEKDILDESFKFSKEIEDDGWGILSDVIDGEEDWSWLNQDI